MTTSFILAQNGLISSKEAALRAGFTNDYLYRLCRLGKVEGQKIGNTWYVKESSLNAFLEQQKIKKEDRKQNLVEERKG